MYKVIEIFRLF